MKSVSHIVRQVYACEWVFKLSLKEAIIVLY